MSTRIFVSYARPDAPVVAQLVRFLNVAGFDTWFDLHDLLPGQDWRFVIEREIARASLLVLCLSTRSVDRTGYFQKELRLAIEQAELRPRGAMFVLPLRFDDCPIPAAIGHLQVLDMNTRVASRLFLEAIHEATGDGARAPIEEHERLTRAFKDYNGHNTA